MLVALGLIVTVAIASSVANQTSDQASAVDIEVLPPPTAPRGAEPTPVQPRDLPSGKVRGHVAFYAKGGPSCGPTYTQRPALKVGFGGPVGIGSKIGICSSGFYDGEATLRIQGPGFQAVSKEPPTGVWIWDVPTYLSPGRYSFQAVRGSRVAIAYARVGASPIPFVRIRSFEDRPMVFEVIVGGVSPVSRVPVHLYRSLDSGTGSQLDYFSTLDIPTDELGNGSRTVRGTGGSAATCYAVALGSKDLAEESQFCFK